MDSLSQHLAQVNRYYSSRESQWGYRLFLGGARHFGYYRPEDASYKFSDALLRMEDKLGNALDLSPDSMVLDAGCGVGVVASALASRFGLHVTGIDISESHLKQARIRAHENSLQDKVRFAYGDYSDIPFPNDIFDAIYTMETFVHSENPDLVLQEFMRVLKPGGKLVMFEYSSTPLDLLNDKARNALIEICDVAAMPAWLILNDGVLETKMINVGFNDVSSTNISVNILPMLGWFSKLGHIPYRLGRMLGLKSKVINAMSGVELYRHQDAWKYQIYTAKKPLIP